MWTWWHSFLTPQPCRENSSKMSHRDSTFGLVLLFLFFDYSIAAVIRISGNELKQYITRLAVNQITITSNIIWEDLHFLLRI